MSILYTNYAKNQGYSCETPQRSQRIQWILIYSCAESFYYYCYSILALFSWHNLRFLYFLALYHTDEHAYISSLLTHDCRLYMVWIFLGGVPCVYSCSYEKMDCIFGTIFTFSYWWTRALCPYCTDILIIYYAISYYSINQYYQRYGKLYTSWNSIRINKNIMNSFV